MGSRFFFFFSVSFRQVCIYLVETAAVELPTARRSRSIVSLMHRINQWIWKRRLLAVRTGLELADDCICSQMNMSNWWVGVTLHLKRCTWVLWVFGVRNFYRYWSREIEEMILFSWLVPQWNTMKGRVNAFRTFNNQVKMVNHTLALLSSLTALFKWKPELRPVFYRYAFLFWTSLVLFDCYVFLSFLFLFRSLLGFR